ncbi:MAG: acyltransferase [Betaproteobacteria bacterium]|nr:acyltransferase [Betaproteobacteria bacterium]
MNSAAHGHDYLMREAASASRADQFNEGLTGIRALAALMVLFFHVFAFAGPRALSFNIGGAQFTYHWLITCSWMGANVFFVLSGFLLAIPFVRHIEGQGARVNVGAYLLRRIKRVVPAYWLQIVVLSIVLYNVSALPAWHVIAAHFVFLQNLRQDYASALNGVYWTLPTEFGYYLLLPLFAACSGLFFARKRAAWLILSMALIATAIAYRSLMYASVADAPVGTKFFVLLQLPGLIDHFGIGMLLSWVYVRLPSTLTPRISDGLVLIGISGIVVMMALVDHFYLDYWNGHPLLFFGYTITATFIGALVLGTAMAGQLSKALFANGPMLYVGIISYSLYLWHIPIIRWTITILDQVGVGGDRLWWLVGICIPASFGVATISYYLVERPFMARKTSSASIRGA